MGPPLPRPMEFSHSERGGRGGGQMGLAHTHTSQTSPQPPGRVLTEEGEEGAIERVLGCKEEVSMTFSIRQLKSKYSISAFAQ